MIFPFFYFQMVIKVGFCLFYCCIIASSLLLTFFYCFYYRTQPNDWITCWWIVGFIATTCWCRSPFPPCPPSTGVEITITQGWLLFLLCFNSPINFHNKCLPNRSKLFMAHPAPGSILTVGAGKPACSILYRIRKNSRTHLYTIHHVERNFFYNWTRLCMRTSELTHVIQ